MASAFAARYLQSSQDLARSETSPSSSSRSSYLSGIFISVDADGDGLITRPQLVQALALSGVLPREATVAAFFDARRKSLLAAPTPPTRRASASSASNAAALQTLVDLPTFIAVISSTLDREPRASSSPSPFPSSSQPSTADALDPLLFFMTQDNAEKDMLSAAQLHHLLVRTLSPTRLGEAEFAKFMTALDLPASIRSRGPNEECIPVQLLKSRLALPQ